jgi:hypothetical protein
MKKTIQICLLAMILLQALSAETKDVSLQFAALKTTGSSTGSSAVTFVVTPTDNSWDFTSNLDKTTIPLFTWEMTGSYYGKVTVDFEVDGPLKNTANANKIVDYTLDITVDSTVMENYWFTDSKPFSLISGKSGWMGYYGDSNGYRLEDPLTGVVWNGSTYHTTIDSSSTPLSTQITCDAKARGGYYYDDYSYYWNYDGSITRQGSGLLTLTNYDKNAVAPGKYLAHLTISITTE